MIYGGMESKQALHLTFTKPTKTIKGNKEDGNGGIFAEENISAIPHGVEVNLKLIKF